MINDYRNAIREHIERLKNIGNLSNMIIWDVQVDEASDPTLLSNRAYNNRQHVDVVLVACGVSGVWEKLPEQRIVLPLLKDVLALRKIYMTDEV
ncbi:hypothetical protein LVY74_00510 [Acinetobacter sp. ME22]|uniref:hypothetical protein n=1 Tax=Acinetobacter sp. ME22 TaxID=2904802 RepID=UPI001EDAF1D8|nr:hypothetical protein [Acinetobacter sp. ME22]MCG2572041.1 hypothetical protein [Acinetobacter sp. ME22]